MREIEEKRQTEILLDGVDNEQPWGYELRRKIAVGVEKCREEN